VKLIEHLTGEAGKAAEIMGFIISYLIPLGSMRLAANYQLAANFVGGFADWAQTEFSQTSL
jgi:hypothetical protein